MDKILHKHIYNSLLFCLAAALIVLPACRKEKMNCPVITGVHNYAASPNDTSLQTISTGQWIVVMGQNLSGVTEVYFGSVPASINKTLFTNESIVVQIPSIPFQSVSRDKLNEITVVSGCGASSFNIDILGEPIISYVRNKAAAPNDTILSAVLPGQEINIVGYNLKNATQIAFQGVPANIANVVFTDTSAIVKVPVDLSGSDASKANTITYTTNIGAGTFSIRIIGPPIITRISYENPNAGDSVYLYGNNFFAVQGLTFAGATVSSYKASEDGASIGFVAPSLTQSGPVVITTAAGTFTTSYNVNDVSTGIISNFEWGPLFRWDWWGGAELKSGDPDFPGNSSQYLVLKNNVLDGGAGDEWSNAVRISNAQWLPESNVGDPVNSWALKFEISVPGAWNGGTICIKSSNGSYMSRYEPWQVSATSTAAYSSKGWQTVIIPLASFRKNDATLGDGKGAPITSIIDLVGSTGKSNLILYMHNYSTSPTGTGFKAAFDNFRIIKR